MTLDDMKALARRANGLWGSDSTDKAEDIFAADYVNHQESHIEGEVEAIDLKQWKALVANHIANLSPASTRILMQVAEGDLVATRWAFTATHTGTFMGAAPSGKTITWTGVQIDRFADGKIVESWVDWDKYSFFQGLGLVA